MRKASAPLDREDVAGLTDTFEIGEAVIDQQARVDVVGRLVDDDGAPR